MTTMTDEELRQFLKDNMTRIQSMLAEEKDCVEEIAGDLRDNLGTAKDDLKRKVSEKKDSVEDTAKEIYHAIMDPAAHKHFVRMGLEFALGISAVMDKMPMPDMVRKFREDMQESRNDAQKEFCKTNEDCAARNRSENRSIERIEIN